MSELSDLLNGAQAPLVVADRNAIRFVVLNRPAARNAMTRAMRADFAGILAEADRDDAVDAVILTGAGGCFSAGVDLKDRVPGAPPVEPNPGAALRALHKPVIAAIDGACVTGALEMALSCAFAIATPAARFADTHCKVGLFPRWGGGAMLSGAIGIRRARQMMLTGDFIDAATAADWGIINEVVPEETLLARASELARTMSASAKAQPLSYRLHSEMLRDFETHSTATAIEHGMLALFDQDKRTG